MHKHYEKLLPNSIYRSNTENFVPYPYFNDFLIVHPYNLKNGNNKQQSYAEAKKALYSSFTTSTPQAQTLPDVDSVKISSEYYSNSANAYPIRRATRANSWRSTNNNEAKITDFDLNHIFLLNKRIYFILIF